LLKTRKQQEKIIPGIKEEIRLHAPLRILDIIDTFKTDIELTNTVSEIEGEVSIEITLDLSQTNLP
jgi:hypothetical protein